MRNIPTVTRYLLIANLLVFLLTGILQRYGIDLNTIGGLHYVSAGSFHWWQPLTLSNMSGSVDAGTLAHYAYFMNTIGASGAVFGILLAFGWLYPDIPMFIIFLPIPIRARTFVIIYALIELFAGLGSVAGFSMDNVAHFAHLGGMLFGWLLILYWRKINWRDPFEKFMRDKEEKDEGRFDNYHYHKRV